MSIVDDSDKTRIGSAGFIGTKYFSARGRDMNQYLCDIGFQIRKENGQYEVTDKGSQYAYGRQWYFGIADVLYEAIPSLKARYDSWNRR